MEALLEYKDFSVYKRTKVSKTKIDNPKGLILKIKHDMDNFFDNCEELTIIKYKPYDLKKVIVPEHKKIWNDSLFMGCANLEEINIPYGVEIIPNNCFWACENLKNIILPETIKRINRFAFSGCHSFKHIIIPENISYIESHAFSDCQYLEDITYKGRIYKDSEEFNCMLSYYRLTDTVINEVWTK